jgi:hypothetical protein
MFSEALKEMSPSERQVRKDNSSRSSHNPTSVNLCSFLASLHSCPTSFASTERWFSTFGLVWSELGNCLGAEKAMKLAKIYTNFHTTSPSDTVELDQQV